MSIAWELLTPIQRAQLKWCRPDLDWERIEATSGREVGEIKETKKGECCDNRLPQGGSNGYTH